ncbi:MAG: DEAD/DEAH box helicase, partial [Actinobacteria bacterium]|nr:DEAD/DEAH box helicase [Actinomycetota bacterium]
MLAGVTTLGEPLARVLGPRTGKRLEETFGMRTVGDLLRHYPRRYYTRGELTDLGSLREGDHVTVLARVAQVSTHPMPPSKSRVEVIVTDDRAKLMLTFFANSRRGLYPSRRLVPGMIGMFAGTVSSFRGRLQLIHPEYEMLPGAPPNADLTPELAAEFAAEMIPVYPASAKVSSWSIAKSVRTALETLEIPGDPLPAGLRERYSLYGRAEAIRAIHRPLDAADRAAAVKRLKWDEAFMLQAALAQRRLAAAAMPAMPRPHVAGGIADSFDAALPFTLTQGQVAVGETIAHELACAYPMHRLLQGEVGSGKTVIAVRAMLQVVDAGGQAALLAPTEVLAQQHYRSITEMLGPLAAGGQLGAAENATGVALLTGSVGAAARRSALSDVFTGDAGIVIGTHALLTEQVQFADLGLVVVDEQHRFGVEQRDALRAKSADKRPHVLVMTATPIPRTVAMTVYGDLETSTLTELPAGRSVIATHVVPAADKPRYLERAWERVREEAGRGRQAYVVCPRIGDGPDPDEPDYPGENDFAPPEATGGIPRGIAEHGRRQPLAV